MNLPPSITRKLQKATCHKIALNCRILRIRRCFKEAQKALGCGCWCPEDKEKKD